MGIRMDQHAGIPPEARTFLAENECQLDPCPCCGHVKDTPVEVIGEYTGMFDENFPLFRHFLKDGGIAEEFLQAAPWSSGPVHFLGLQVFHVEDDRTLTLIKEFIWSNTEMLEA